jgi:hypothetical protein
MVNNELSDQLASNVQEALALIACLHRARDEAYQFNLVARAAIRYSRGLLELVDERTTGALIGRRSAASVGLGHRSAEF